MEQRCDHFVRPLLLGSDRFRISQRVAGALEAEEVQVCAADSVVPVCSERVHLAYRPVLSPPHSRHPLK